MRERSVRDPPDPWDGADHGIQGPTSGDHEGGYRGEPSERDRVPAAQRHVQSDQHQRVQDRPMTRPAPIPPGQLWPLLAVISLGGALGALARYGLETVWPHSASGVSWTTLAVNASGSALIGVLMELLNHRRPTSRLLQPFWGAGVLGGYTTFSAYALDILTALEHGTPQIALAYLALTLASALAGVWAASTISHRILTSRKGST